MAQNKIYHLNPKEVSRIKEKVKNLIDVYLVEINGKEIQSWEDYIKKIEETFKLPTRWINNIDAYNDWMRDLGWLKKRKLYLNNL